MVAIFLKAIFIYFIFSFFRSLWRGYKMVDKIKKNANHQFKDFNQYQGQGQATEDYQYQSQHGTNQSKNKSDIIEAEFRVIDKNK
jgi:hypothetical protein